MQYRVKGWLIRRRFNTSPFAGTVKTDVETKDEQQWNAYVDDMREMLNDESWDPVTYEDGSSTRDDVQKARTG